MSFRIILLSFLFIAIPSLAQTSICWPNNYGPSAKSNDVYSLYTNWLKMYVTNQGCPPNAYRVKRPSDNNDTVSEGIGYGMLITAYLANMGHDTKKYFDGFYAYYKYHADSYGLMNWQINANGTVKGSDAATDGDLDAAMALVVAARIWGNEKGINYKEEASDLIKKIMKYEVESGTWFLLPGDKMGSDVLNLSYFSPAYFGIFEKMTGNSRWKNVISKNYDLLANFCKPGTTGLCPDWCRSDGSPAANTNTRGYHYKYDAARTPWRIGVDYLWYGQSHSSICYTYINILSTWFCDVETSGNPALIKDGYTLSGDPSVGNGLNNAVFTGPVGVASMGWNNQNWCNDLYTTLRSFGTNGYFKDIVQLLTMLAMSGNMPNIAEKPVSASITFSIPQSKLHDNDDITVNGTTEKTVSLISASIRDQNGKLLTTGIVPAVNINTNNGVVSGTINIGRVSLSYPTATTIKAELLIIDGTGMNSTICRSVEYPISSTEKTNLKIYNNLIDGHTTKSCTIKYGDTTKSFPIEINIYDLNNRFIRTLLKENKSAGLYTAEWDGKDKNGNLAASGIYLVRIKMGDSMYLRKIAVVR